VMPGLDLIFFGVLLIVSVLPFSVVSFGRGQPLPDQFKVLLGGGDALLRFLLKRMKDVNDISKAHGVDRPPCIGLVVYNDLKDRPASKSLKRFYGRIFLATLRRIKRLPDVTLNGFRKSF
jgi:hypothetical protein